MSNQDWNVVTFNSKVDKSSTSISIDKQKFVSAYIPEKGTVKLEAPKNLGLLISQARTTKNKTQKLLAADLGISSIILSRWESNKEIPDNSQIAKIENILKTKLPRCKKLKTPDN